MTEKLWLTCPETAKLVRAALKNSFPGVKFSVRSHTYSGGASINVDWTDGPDTKSVERVAKRFEGSDFDGMIDLKVSLSSWLLPDGSVQPANSQGTQGSMGVIPAFDNPQPTPDARLVRFGADYVFCTRN